VRFYAYNNNNIYDQYSPLSLPKHGKRACYLYTTRVCGTAYVRFYMYIYVYNRGTFTRGFFIRKKAKLIIVVERPRSSTERTVLYLNRNFFIFF